MEDNVAIIFYLKAHRPIYRDNCPCASLMLRTRCFWFAVLNLGYDLRPRISHAFQYETPRPLEINQHKKLAELTLAARRTGV
jgi:hypothetical protein